MKREQLQACDDLMRLLEIFKRATLQLGEEYSLTRMQVFVLHLLQQHHELAMGKIADMLHCDASNVTGIVDRLVIQKLVSRQELASDRRTKTLSLTEKGQQIVDDLHAALPAKLGCDRLSSQEVTTLRTIADKLS